MLLELLMKPLFVAGNDGFPSPSDEYPPTHLLWQIVNGYFEKCLVLCNKFPRIWIMYCQFLMHQPSRITFARRTFDRALKALPPTQHKDIWDLYLEFGKSAGGETAVRVWRRFVRLQPTHGRRITNAAERFCDILLGLQPPRTAEAALVLTAIIENPEKYASPAGKTVFEIWLLLCRIIIEHPNEIICPRQKHLISLPDFNILNVEKVLRTGISKFHDHVASLWIDLAKWYILKGDFDRAHNIYEEALKKVRTVKDFTLIFDTYAKMEEQVLNNAMEKLSTLKQNEIQNISMDDQAVDFRLARFERLMQRRSFLVSDVILRQNPNNVNAWRNRVNLHLNETDEDNAVQTFRKACNSIHPFRAIGNFHELWVEFAKFFEDRGFPKDANAIFEEAVNVKFKQVDHLAFIWCQWAEMLMRAGDFNGAKSIIGRATSPTVARLDIRYDDESRPPQQRLFKSVKLWSFYADLEESVGTVESAKAVYDRILELKIATPQIIINYASFLEEQKFYEEVFARNKEFPSL
jgi:pre-mRNA-splicing factor SYF1